MRYDMSAQEALDRKMCKPGYTWNATLGKCLGYGGGPETGETAAGAIKQEAVKRANGDSAPLPAPAKTVQ